MSLLIYPKFSAQDISGVNLSGGLVYFYEVGTTTPKDTYTDSTLGTPNTNPVVLNSRGEADIYLDGSYKIVLNDSDNAEIWTEPDYSGESLGSESIKSYANVAALRAITSAPQITQVKTKGYYTDGDGGAIPGGFYWDSTSTEADNGGTIIKATAITTGRFKGIYSGAVNVKWFGAKGDDLTDEQAAFQSCLDYITALTNGGTMDVPAGKYRFLSYIDIGSNTTIDMDKNAYLIRAYTHTSPADKKWNSAFVRAKAALLASPLENIHIKGGIIKTLSDSFEGVNLALYWVDKASVIGTRFNGVNGDFNTAFHCNDLIIDQIEIDGGDDVFEDGIHIEGGTDITISNSIINSGDDCIALAQEYDVGDSDYHSNIENVTISNCTLNSTDAFGVKIHQPYANTEGSSCYTRKVTITGITGNASNANNGLIKFDNDDVTDTSRVRDISLDGFEMEGAGTAASAANTYGLFMQYVSNVKVKNGTLRNAIREGLRIENSDDITIDAVNVYDIKTSGFGSARFNSCTNIKLLNSRMDDANTQNSVIIDACTDVLIQGNDIMNIPNTKIGVSFLNACDRVKQIGNTYSKAGGATASATQPSSTTTNFTFIGNDCSNINTGVAGMAALSAENTNIKDNVGLEGKTHTISAGTLTTDGGKLIIVAGQGDAADNLFTINAGGVGHEVILKAEKAANAINVDHGGGNIILDGGTDESLSTVNETLSLINDGTNYLQTGYSDNP